MPYLILERIVDIDSLMSMWRFRHALVRMWAVQGAVCPDNTAWQVVHRTIGTKLGTGGSSGYGYLK